MSKYNNDVHVTFYPGYGRTDSEEHIFSTVLQGSLLSMDNYRQLEGGSIEIWRVLAFFEVL